VWFNSYLQPAGDIVLRVFAPTANKLHGTVKTALPMSLHKPRRIFLRPARKPRLLTVAMVFSAALMLGSLGALLAVADDGGARVERVAGH